MPKGALRVREGISWTSLLEISAHQHGWALMSDQVQLLCTCGCAPTMYPSRQAGVG